MVKEFKPIYNVTGRITDAKKHSLEGLIVRAYHHNLEAPNIFLGRAVTNVDGQYNIRFTEKRLKPLDKKGGGPDVFIRVLDGDELLGESKVIPHAKKRITINFQVDHTEKVGTQESSFSVCGLVCQSNGRPLRGVIVRAYDQGLRNRSRLGEVKKEAKIGTNGHYRINYTKEDLLEPERENANLLVEVIDKNDATIAQSKVLFKARPQETVNLIADIDTNTSEWEQLEAQIQPVLRDTRLTDLADHEIAYLEESSGLTSEQLKPKILAAKAAIHSELPDWFHYALLRQGLPEELNALLEMPLNRVEEALAKAEASRIVPGPTLRSKKALWRQFQSLQADYMLDKPVRDHALRVRDVLGAAGFKEGRQHKLAVAMIGKDLNDPAYWSTVQTENNLKAQDVKKVKLAFEMVDLTSGHLRVISFLLKDRRIKHLQDLARHYGPEDWLELVRQSMRRDGKDIPDDVPGEKPRSRRQFYASLLYDRVAEAQPNAAVIFGLKHYRKTDKGRLAKNRAVNLLPKILDGDPKFDLATVRVDAYVREHGKSLGIHKGDVAKEAAVRDDLKRVQRVYRLRSEPRTVARLLEDGLDSSSAILSLGREKFVDEYGKDFDKNTAREIYTRAETNAGRAMAFCVRFSPIFNTGPVPDVINDCPAELTGVPDYATLFGSLDGCECVPCESVYSPAAYLTDLLAFLANEVKGDMSLLVPINGFAALIERSFCERDGKLRTRQPRRSDIPKIKLSCRNAETLIPYVDLVLEILEEAVSPQNNITPQTELSAEEIAAQQEHFNVNAYRTLEDTLFPFDMPFDLWHEEELVYFDALGTSRTELLETFFPIVENGSPDDSPDDLTEILRWKDTEIARARLGLSDNEWNIIGDESSARAQEAWGFGLFPMPRWWYPLRVVDTFMERCRLEYSDLLRLLTLKSINPRHELWLSFEDPKDCDPRKIRIEGLNQQALAFIYRFLRLQRALNVSLREMDQLLLGLFSKQFRGRPALDGDFLVRMSHFQYLRRKFSLPFSTLLSWWSTLDTVDYNADFLPPNWTKSRSTYEQLFLTGRVRETRHDAFQLKEGRTELKDSTQTINDDHRSVIAGTLGLPFPAVEELVSNLLGELNGKLTLSNLSLIYRHASIASALHLSVTDYLVVKKLVGFDPFTSADGVDKTIQTIRFVERVELVQLSGISVAEVDYVLRQTEPYESGHTVAPTDEWVASSLETLHTAFRPVSAIEAPWRSLEQAIKKLDEGAALDIADEFRSLLERTQEQIRPAAEVVMENALLSLLRESLALVEAGLPGDLTDLRSKVIKARDILEGALIQGLAIPLSELLGVSAATAIVLLEKVLSPKDVETSASKVFLSAFAPVDAGDGVPGLNDASREELGLLLRSLHKAALIIGRLEITHQELSWIVIKSPNIGWLNVTRLPVLDSPQTPDFEAFWKLVRLIQLRNLLLPEQQENLATLFDITERNEGPGKYTEKLAELTGWNKDDVETLTEPGGILQAGYPEHYADERLPIRILTIVRLLRRLGVGAADVRSWTPQALPVDDQTKQINRLRQALKARYGEDWKNAVTKLRDPLRQRQRQALVQYLLHEWNLAEASELSDHFLIDVEMSPCMMTSRLVQATASVQLFVQRLLMNLEPGLYLTEEGAELWEWMKNYRMWEANRKVFLYPENWIEPELRDDKTPFFEELENELLQADINNATAETALQHYLEKLHEVAKLQVCGQYLESGKTDTLHVFARTRDVPHRYYYRRFIVGDDEGWTPWKRVDVDIEGDHLIPIVYNRRMYLFWPVFTEKDEKAFSQLEEQILRYIRDGYQLHAMFYKLQSQVAAFILTVRDSVMTSILEPVQTGMDNIVNGLNILGAGLSSFNDRFNDVELELNAQITRFHIPDLVRDIPGLKDLYELIEGLIESVRNKQTNVFGARVNLFVDPIGPVNILPTPPYSDPLDLIHQITQLIEEMVNFVDKTIGGATLNVIPAKRLEVQLAWSENKNDSWTAKRTSSGRVSFRDVITPLFESVPAIPGTGETSTTRLFTFSSEIDGDNQLNIRCHIALPSTETSKFTLWKVAAKHLKYGEQCNYLNVPLYFPNEIGYFRLSGCNGRLEAVDLSEEQFFSDLLGIFFTGFASRLKEQLGHAVKKLHGIPQLQLGEPVTPDDDPLRPSPLRCSLESSRIPRHYYKHKSLLDGGEIYVEDVYRILARHQDPSSLEPISGFFYQDASRLFFCYRRQIEASQYRYGYGYEGGEYVFMPFYHPYSCALLENLQRFGIPGIYDTRFDSSDKGVTPALGGGQPLQIALRNDTFFAPDEYDPVDNVYNPAYGDNALRPIEEINFSTIGSYAQYNWEIFFHIPLLIASRLHTHQKFREAQQWFHYIFNPTDASRGSVPEKYWRTKPFVETSQADYERQQIDALMQMLNTEAGQTGLQELERAVRNWRNDAFNPHLVARTRGTAYQKAVVMKYIDNLIAWGDYLFSRETREAINEATQLYVLAAKLLGPRPQLIPDSGNREELSFDELEERRPFDAFSNAWVEIESYLPAPIGMRQIAAKPGLVADSGRLDPVSLAPVDQAWRALVKSRSLLDVINKDDSYHNGDRQNVESLYFCVPQNEKLLEKWDIVSNRLFKIRNCQNIEGRVFALPLLAPPIDPAILVRAKAKGVDIDSVLGQLFEPLPHYRFQVLVQKATELCGETRSLGSALLMTVEKRDGEALAMLRNTHEIRMLEAIKSVKERQVNEAKLTLEGLKWSQEATILRRNYYQRLLMGFMSPEEVVDTTLRAGSLLLQAAQFGVSWGASAASLIPNIKAGFVTTLGATSGGENISGAAENTASAIGQLASVLSSTGGLISTMGSYRRRAEDWLLQIQLANKELDSIDEQIAASEIRVEIAESDLENHKLQTQHSKEISDFMQRKFTNQELYDWMVAQTAALYFKSYQLTYELAQRCERAYAFELGVDLPSLIQPGYWDTLKKGLLAGEQLHHDLKQLEVAYLDTNSRDYELTKHISLLSLDPLQLIKLREIGKAEFGLPEALFDVDFPGHYMRRIKSVSITIPCVTGPYTGVSGTLRLLQSRIRRKTGKHENKYPPSGNDDPRFVVNHAATRAVATSTGQNDSGLFELNFRDERYLPFEGEGVESMWELSLNKEFAQFDYDTISDVILHLRYTAREGGDQQKDHALKFLGTLSDALMTLDGKALPLVRLFSVRHEFPTEWAKFRNQTPEGDQGFGMTLDLRRDHYPFWSQGRLNKLEGLEIWVRRDEGSEAASIPFDGQLPDKPYEKIEFSVETNAILDMWVLVTWSM